jgi:hypothetical protein
VGFLLHGVGSKRYKSKILLAYCARERNRNWRTTVKKYQPKEQPKKSWAAEHIEHSFLGSMLVAVDTTTGKRICALLGFGRRVYPYAGAKETLELEGYDPSENYTQWTQAGSYTLEDVVTAKVISSEYLNQESEK